MPVSEVHIPSSHLKSGEGRFSIFLPDGYDDSGHVYPVLYLLHGVLEDNASCALKSRACGPFIIVMPEGFTSFYVDRFTFFDGRPGNEWDSYFNLELKPYIEENYRVAIGRDYTAVAGISMGGYGALYQAFTHPDKYCLCWSVSGASCGLDFTGITDRVPSVASLASAMAMSGKDSFAVLPEIHLECGRPDPVCGLANLLTHRSLVRLGVPHDYSVSPGTHSWRFWRGSIGRLVACLTSRWS